MLLHYYFSSTIIAKLLDITPRTLLYLSSVEASKITQRELTTLMKRWQKRLRLQDWKIKVKLASADQIEREHGEPAYGICDDIVEARSAVIWICKNPPADDVSMGGRQDPENTLVHELLHLHFAPFGNKHPEDELAHEQAIEAITEALLKNE